MPRRPCSRTETSPARTATTHSTRNELTQCFDGLDGGAVDYVAAVDFFTVPTETDRILFCFVVLRHHRRTLVHFNVTANPTAGWTAQQVAEAFPEEAMPRFLIRDRDSIYGEFFGQRIKHMGIERVVDPIPLSMAEAVR